MGIRKVFEKSGEPEGLSAEMKGLLEDMRRERGAFEVALARAADAEKDAKALADSVAQAQKAAEQLGGQLAAVEGVAERVRSVQSELDALSAGGREARDQVDETGRLVREFRSDFDLLRSQMQEVTGLRAEVVEIIGLAAPARQLETRVRGAEARLDEAAGRRDEISKSVADAASRLAEVQGRFDRIAAGVEGMTARAEAFAQTAAELKQLTTDAPNLKRELGTLRAMAEFVSQKVAALEGQRDAVERATRRAEGLTELMAQVDRQYAEQQTNAKFLGQLEERVHGLKQMHASLLEQTEQIRRRQLEIETLDRAQRESFERARAEVQDALSGFAFERDGLAAMHQRVEELRSAAESVQQRLPTLDTATAGLAEAEAAAERLGARVAALREEVAQTEAAAAALGPLREEIGRVESEAREMLRRVESAKQPTTAALDETERRVAELNEAVDGLERRAVQVEGYRAGLAEMAREINARQSALDRALAQLDKAVGLRAESAELAGRLESETEALRSRLTEAGEATTRAEGQLAEFEERARRLPEVGARLAALERRFRDVLDAGDKVDRLQSLLEQRVAAMNAIRDDLARMFGTADATAEKVRSVAGLQKEIEQRRQAMEEMAGKLRQLDKYTEQLEAREQQFREAERQLQLLDAHLSDMKATLGTVLEQREFLEKVIEATGTLAFQTMQAESVLAQLREERGEAGGGPAGGKGPMRPSIGGGRP